MTRSTLRSLIAAFAAVLVAGCGSDSPNAPSATPQQHTLDLAAILSEMSIGRVSTVPGASVVLAVPAAVGVPVIAPAACPFSASTQGFTCPTVSSGGLTFDISYFLYDAAGHAQSAADAATTASVRTVVDTKGTTSLPQTNGTGGTVIIADHSDMTMSGLLTATRTLNGNGASHYDLTLTGATPLHAVMDMTTATKDVVLPTQSDASSPAFPLSGTITTDSKTVTSIASLGTLTATAHSVITFNGTSKATIVYTSSLSTSVTTCTVDLTGKSPPVCS
jgi:hypothetical protein